MISGADSICWRGYPMTSKYLAVRRMHHKSEKAFSGNRLSSGYEHLYLYTATKTRRTVASISEAACGRSCRLGYYLRRADIRGRKECPKKRGPRTFARVNHPASRASIA